MLKTIFKLYISNLEPFDYKANTLPTELTDHNTVQVKIHVVFIRSTLFGFRLGVS